MIGLPYLFRVLSPVLNKLIIEEQENNNGVLLKGNTTAFDETNLSSLNTDYELNEDIDSSDLETNCLAIQVACSLFISSLQKTKTFCPNEFKNICKVINDEVIAKFPQHKINHALSAFIFLRYFVAGLAVPETFGILSEPPKESLRRKLILISKVITNLSTNVRFGEKEEFMTIMNDFLNENEKALENYYNYLINYSENFTETISIPPKYAFASYEVLRVHK